MFRIAICEDNQQHLRIMQALLVKYNNARPGIDIKANSFSTGKELLGSLGSARNFDVFLLDIVMPDMNGIELAGEIRMRNTEVPLVFLTASSDYALDAFNVSAMQYLLKPVVEGELFPVLDKIVSVQKREMEKFLLVSTQEQKVKISFREITCVESMRRTLCIYLTNGSKLNSRTIRVPFETAIAPLLLDSRFLHAHKSYVLNMAHVESLNIKSFIMNGGTQVPVPRYKYASAKNQYLEYLSKCGIGQLGGEG